MHVYFRQHHQAYLDRIPARSGMSSYSSNAIKSCLVEPQAFRDRATYMLI